MSRPCPVCGWQAPEGWTFQAQPIADQWMVYPPPGFGARFPVSLNDMGLHDHAPHVLIRQRVEQRIREIEADRVPSSG